MTEINISKKNQRKFLALRKTCIKTLNNIIAEELKRSNKGKEPNILQLVGANYSLFVQFASLLMLDADRSIKEWSTEMETRREVEKNGRVAA